MKTRFKLVLSTTILAAMLSLMAGSTAFAQGPTTLTGFSVSDINIRTAPGQSAGSVGILPASDKFVAIGRNDGNNWVQIQYGTTTGWVAAWLTVYSGDTALLPIASGVNPQPVGGPPPLDMTSPFNVNLRSSPDTKAGLMVMIPFQAHANVIGRTNSSSWVNVEYEGANGWVARWLVILSGDVNLLPVTSGETPLETPVFATEPVDGGATPVPTAGSGTPQPGTAVPPPPDGGIAVKTPGKANIRSAPSSEAPIIGVMSYADINAVVVGQNASRNWLQIINGGTQGWVARWVVLTSESTAGLPITDDSGEVLPVPGGSAVLVKGIYDIFIRSGPDINFGSVAALPAYTSVTANARNASNDWVKVSFQNVEGWVAAWVITASGDYTNLPVEETGVP